MEDVVAHFKKVNGEENWGVWEVDQVSCFQMIIVMCRHHICQKIYATAILGLKNLRKKSGICDKTSSGQNNVNALKWPLIAYLV